MASKYLQKYPVPEGFHQILHDFAREVLRDQPEDIIKYGAEYFECMSQGREFKFESRYNIAKGQAPGRSYLPPKPKDLTGQARTVVETSNQRPKSQQRPQSKRSGSAHPADISMGSQASHPEEKQAAKDYVEGLYSKFAEDIDKQEAGEKQTEEQLERENWPDEEDAGGEREENLRAEEGAGQEGEGQERQEDLEGQEGEGKAQVDSDLPELNTFNDKDMEKIVKIQAAAKGSITRKQIKEKSSKDKVAQQPQIPEQQEVPEQQEQEQDS